MASIWKETLKDYFTPLTWPYRFFKWLFWLGYKTPDPKETTLHFQSFERYYRQEDAKKGIWKQSEEYRVQYIHKIQSSPFVGDHDFKKAEQLLVEWAIKKNVI